MKIVISLGGSLLTKDLSAENFKKYIDVVKRLRSKEHKLIIVCGGGKVCREYRDIAKALGADVGQLDFVGIMATHLNASTFVAGLGKSGYLIAWKHLKDTIKEVRKNFGEKILVGAGYDIGTSSDYDAAFFAELVKADLLINASNIDGVYSDDPKKNPDARRFDRLTHKEFLKIILKNPQTPGEYRLFDLPAARLIKKLRLKTIFINGQEPEEIMRAVEGGHKGTVVC